MSSTLDLYVPIKLDKPRKLKLTIDDMIEVYDTLNSAVPPRRTEIDGLTIHSALARFDWRAWATVLWAGLRHNDPALEALDTQSGPDEVLPLVRRYVEKGEDLETLGEAIRLAMMKSGCLPRKLWEKVDGKKAKRKTDGVLEGTQDLEGPREVPESQT